MQTSDLRKFTQEVVNYKNDINRFMGIPIDVFLSWLTVPVKKVETSCFGWSTWKGDNGLCIKSDFVANGTECVDSIYYGNRILSSASNAVNAFCIFDILNDEGKAFFKNFYKDAIAKQIAKLDEQAKKAQQELEETKAFWAQF